MLIVEKFLAKDKTLAFSLNTLSADCLSSAASYGLESMIPLLLNLSISLDGLGKQCYVGITSSLDVGSCNRHTI
jgi:hypothetical protein